MQIDKWEEPKPKKKKKHIQRNALCKPSIIYIGRRAC